MTVKATAHTEPRGALWSIGCQPSAAESCSPTATHGRSMLECTIHGPGRCSLIDRRTQWMVLSAAIDKRCIAEGLWGPSSILRLSLDANCSVIVDSKDAVGRRRRHAVKMACAVIAHEARGALSGISGRRHGRWCRVLAASSARRSAPSELFFNRNAYVPMTHVV